MSPSFCCRRRADCTSLRTLRSLRRPFISSSLPRPIADATVHGFPDASESAADSRARPADSARRFSCQAFERSNNRAPTARNYAPMLPHIVAQLCAHRSQLCAHAPHAATAAMAAAAATYGAVRWRQRRDDAACHLSNLSFEAVLPLVHCLPVPLWPCMVHRCRSASVGMHGCTQLQHLCRHWQCAGSVRRPTVSCADQR